MKGIATARNVDLLLVDSGDLHDGNGISDTVVPGRVRGYESNRLFSRLPYDALTAGNHELYDDKVARDVHDNFVPGWNGRYLTSNVDIKINVIEENGTTRSVPIGERYTKFVTARGRRVTAFGVLFNFDKNPKISVQKVERMVQEAWFCDAIEEAPDFFLLVGHMAVVDSGWKTVIKAIRSKHPKLPVFIFGGHSHIRDCNTFDDERAVALQSGKYMDTVGWLSASIPSDPDHPFKFSRRYLDPSRISYQFHSNTTERDFDTEAGLQLTSDLEKLSLQYRLDEVFGVAPQHFYLDRVPYPEPDSVVSLYVHKVLPTVLSKVNPERSLEPRIIFTNSGVLRFDIFKGPFTRNDQFIASPFGNIFKYVRAPYGIASRVLKKLEEYGDHYAIQGAKAHQPMLVQDLAVDGLHQREQDDHAELTLGYVTKDSCSNDAGDDVLHKPLPKYASPAYVSHEVVPSGLRSDNTTVDVIFLEFLTSNVIRALKELQAGRGGISTEWEPIIYTSVMSNEMLGRYALENWQTDSSHGIDK